MTRQKHFKIWFPEGTNLNIVDTIQKLLINLSNGIYVKYFFLFLRQTYNITNYSNRSSRRFEMNYHITVFGKEISH